jgi:hypothetical protein
MKHDICFKKHFPSTTYWWCTPFDHTRAPSGGKEPNESLESSNLTYKKIMMLLQFVLPI